MRTLLLALLLVMALPGVTQAQTIYRYYRFEVCDRPTPFVIAGLKIDPEQLVVTDQSVRIGDVIATGPAEYFGTAVLTSPTTMTGGVGQRVAPAGTLLHRAEFVQPDGDNLIVLQFWCGALGQDSSSASSTYAYCPVQTRDGLSAVRLGGVGWLATAPILNMINDRRIDRFDFEVVPVSDVPAMQVRFRIARGMSGRVRLRLEAVRGEEVVSVMTADQRPQSGEVDFPLWTHRLRVNVARGQVTARLTEDGDGTGLPEVGEYVRS